MLRCNGETVQKLNERFNLQHAGSEHPFKHVHGKIPSDHFTMLPCNQIIETSEGGGRNKTGAMVPSKEKS